MLKILPLLFTCLLACRPAPGWRPPTFDDQFRNAAVVLVGTVAQTNGDQNTGSATFSNVQWYKGSGPRTVFVDGFRSSAACGVDTPPVGEKIIVFGCVEKRTNVVTLNSFTIGAGATYVNENIEEELKSKRTQRTTPQNRPNGRCKKEY